MYPAKAGYNICIKHILKYVGVMNADENFGEEKIFSGGLNDINPIIRGTLTMTEYLSTL